MARAGQAPRRPLAVAAGLAVGACLTWNVSNVGAAADPLARTYGVSLGAVGLLTTALFVTHLAVQLPAGRAADRLGARTVALASVAAALLGNAVLLADDSCAPGAGAVPCRACTAGRPRPGAASR